MIENHQADGGESIADAYTREIYAYTSIWEKKKK